MDKLKVILIVCTALLCSCQKNECAIYVEPGAQNETIVVTVGFGLAGTSTRSFLDDMAEGWAWESEIHRINFYVYGPGGLVVAVIAQADDITLGSIDLKLPAVLKDVPVTVYAAANTTAAVRPPAKESEMMNLIVQENLSILNTGLAALRENPPAEGLLMSGKASCVPGDGVSVDIELKRAVAKIVLELHLSDDFYTTHDGSGFTLNKVSLRRQSSYTYVMEGGTVRNGGTLWSGTNVSGVYENGVYRFVFYTHESDTGGDQNEIRISGSYYIGTSNVGASYDIAVEAVNPSLIRRNTCYRIKGEIYSLGFNSTIIQGEVLQWTTLPGQDVEIGSN